MSKIPFEEAEKGESPRNENISISEDRIAPNRSDVSGANQRMQTRRMKKREEKEKGGRGKKGDEMAKF